MSQINSFTFPGDQRRAPQADAQGRRDRAGARAGYPQHLQVRQGAPQGQGGRGAEEGRGGDRSVQGQDPASLRFMICQIPFTILVFIL